MTTRLTAERAWHDARFSQVSERRISEAVKQRYCSPRKRALFPREALFVLAGDVRGKDVLAFGCGDDSFVPLLGIMGARVTAFDLSIAALRAQQEMAEANQTGVTLTQAAAEQLPFATQSFDLIIGTAILHHLPEALSELPKELRRILRPSGKALFLEPVNLSNWLYRLRWKLFPAYNELSPGERQLTQADLLPFAGCRCYYFRMLARFDRYTMPGRDFENSPRWRQWLTRSLYFTDHVLLSFPPLHSLAGQVIVRIER